MLDRDKYGRLKPFIKHSKGLGAQWAQDHVEQLRRDLGIPYYAPDKWPIGKFKGDCMFLRYAPIPRYYKKIAGITKEDYASKVKEYMEADFVKYEKETGKSAFIDSSKESEWYEDSLRKIGVSYSRNNYDITEASVNEFLGVEVAIPIGLKLILFCLSELSL